MKASHILVPVLLAAMLASCAGGPRATTAPSAETAAGVEPTPTPTPVPEQVIEPPSAEAVPSVEVQEELPEDIQELNRRGYLRDIFFDTDEYRLRDEARDTLADNAAWLAKYPDVEILIEGHCDERNTREYNLALGERRANAAREYLISLGIDGSRVRTRSYGEERPFAVGHTESAWQLNRRAHFVIVAR
jgi:peptidoglycan-associated lipoprotein